MLLARESVNSGLLFDLAKLDAEIKELTQKSEAEDFWNDRNSALETISRLNHSREIVETYRALLSGQKDLEELLAFEDDSFLEQIETSLNELNKQSKDFELQILFTGEFDGLNAIVEIHTATSPLTMTPLKIYSWNKVKPSSSMQATLQAAPFTPTKHCNNTTTDSSGELTKAPTI